MVNCSKDYGYIGFQIPLIMISPIEQGKGGSSKERKLERRILVMHGWQRETTDGPKGGWSCDIWNGCNGMVWLSVVWCNVA